MAVHLMTLTPPPRLQAEVSVISGGREDGEGVSLCPQTAPLLCIQHSTLMLGGSEPGLIACPLDDLGICRPRLIDVQYTFFR